MNKTIVQQVTNLKDSAALTTLVSGSSGFGAPVELEQGQTFQALVSGVLHVQGITHPDRGFIRVFTRTLDGIEYPYSQHMPFGGHTSTVTLAIAAGTRFRAVGGEGARNNLSVRFVPLA